MEVLALPPVRSSIWVHGGRGRKKPLGVTQELGTRWLACSGTSLQHLQEEVMPGQEITTLEQGSDTASQSKGHLIMSTDLRHFEKYQQRDCCFLVISFAILLHRVRDAFINSPSFH